ncbi:MAG TPA: YrzE family protein [Pyrinomonadaceae bacterium]|nr:YrzE family protein [Pyrinomonadaceae bacterium]
MFSLRAPKVLPSLPFRRRMLAITLVAFAYVGLSALANTPTVTEGRVVESSQKLSMRYRVETDETATFYVGQPGKFKVVLLDQNGKRLDAPMDLETTITVTTLATPDEAKQWLASNKIQSRQSVSKSRVRRITLAQGQETTQIKVTHRKGEEDESYYLLYNQPGVVHIFVESPDVAMGDTVVAVLKSKGSIQPRIARPFDSVSSPVRMMPIVWQDDLANQFKLDMQPAKPIIYTSQGEQVGYFKVVLQSATNEPEPAPRDLVVMLRVDSGYARFEPDTLTIPEGEAMSRKPAELRTRAGGSLTVSASTSRINNVKIIPVTRTYEFSPGIHSTALSLQPQQENAYANGQDAIELRVEALQDGRAITPEEEGMEERKIFFRFIGNSQGVKFENGKGEVTIPKGQQTGTIKLFAVRSISDLKVMAESWNGLRNKISSTAAGVPISFSFPWIQLLCALIGGVVFSLFGKHDWRGLAWGAAMGVLFFSLAFFGALLSDPQKLGTVSVVFTKLPTENALASLILGFLGSTLLGGIFIGVRRLRTASGGGS